MSFSYDPFSQPEPEPEAPEIAGRRIAWTGGDIFKGILLFGFALLILPVFFILPLLLLYETDQREYLIPAVLVSGVIYIAVTGIAAYFTFGKYGGGWDRIGLRPPTRSTWLWGGAATVAALAASAAYSGIVIGFDIEWLRQDPCDQVPAEIRNDALVLSLTAVTAILFAPVAEEIFFRGFLFTGLAKLWGIAVAVVVSGVLFGAVHLVNPELYRSLIPISIIGMVFAVAYLKSRNLYSAIGGHMAFNTVGMIGIAATEC
jgi:membrane protease YdiL (CAAX protease family)